MSKKGRNITKCPMLEDTPLVPWLAMGALGSSGERGRGGGGIVGVNVGWEVVKGAELGVTRAGHQVPPRCNMVRHG